MPHIRQQRLQCAIDTFVINVKVCSTLLAIKATVTIVKEFVTVLDAKAWIY
jgi:hypothetical protein